MKTLILLRHAQAAPGAPDHDRRLDAAGRRQAAAAGRCLSEAGLHPGTALVSDARRTRETFDAAAALLGPVRLVLEPGLYAATVQTIHAAIRAAPEPDPVLLVIGHNPGLGDAARALASDGPADAMARLRARFPTGAAAVIDFTAERWSEVGADGRLRALLPDERW